jgi:hypothetical protein
MGRSAQFLHIGGALFVAAVLIATPRTASSQVIRGRVTDPAGAPAAGAVVTLVRPATRDSLPGTEIRSVLADGRGIHRNAGPGSWRIIVGRIGSRPYRSGILT